MINDLFSSIGVDYEVAVDILGAIISHHAAAIGAEYEKASPDGAVIAAARKAQSELRTIRDDLDPKDGEAIERVIAQYGPLARELYYQ